MKPSDDGSCKNCSDLENIVASWKDISCVVRENGNFCSGLGATPFAPPSQSYQYHAVWTKGEQVLNLQPGVTDFVLIPRGDPNAPGYKLARLNVKFGQHGNNFVFNMEYLDPKAGKFEPDLPPAPY